jgi:MOSC domain-containing protein YiiM
MELAGIQIRTAKGGPLKVLESGVLVAGQGIAGDWHQGGTRQVSLLGQEAVEALQKRETAGLCLAKYSANFLVHSVPFETLQAGDCLLIGEAKLELTEVGKPCHAECALFQQKTQCALTVMSGFARVLEGGEIQVGDSIRIIKSCKVSSLK